VSDGPEAKDFSSSLYAQTSPEAPQPVATGGKSRPGRDADHWPPSSAEAKNEWELYLLTVNQIFDVLSINSGLVMFVFISP
jgi:hypothetical protein